MKRKTAFLLLAGILIGTGLGAAVVFREWVFTSPPTDPPQVGKPLVDFEAVTLEGERVKLSDLRGTPVVLNFWATWCIPCLEEMPMLQKAAQEAEGRVRVIALNNGEPAGVVRDYLVKHGITLPVWLDQDSRAVDAMFVRGFPTTFFVDSRGNLMDQQVGQLSEEILKEKIADLEANP